MNIMRETSKVNPEKWARYKYNRTDNIGENKARITGCKEHILLSKKIASEGMVLLENNGLLPLNKGTTVALFGIGSLDYVKGGGGSGSVHSAYVRNLYEGFASKEPQISIYKPVTEYYYNYATENIANYQGDKLFEEIALPKQLVSDAAKKAEVAIITIHRFSGEFNDRSSQKGDFYLTDIEQKLVDDVTAVFKHSVAVLNVGGMIDVSWIKSNKKIDAALLAWQAGMEGGTVIADILCGDVNPSGKLTDTFAKTFDDYPSAETFNENDDFVNYFEDIYVGYRYFETIPNADKKVNYPFGYGLSYTTFDISKPIAKQIGTKIEVSVTVKNTGKCAGKEVVQIYFSAPQGVLGKSKLNLAAFEKTKLLQPKESQNITLCFEINDMASYDDVGKLCMSAYLLEKGDYTFYAGNCCRDLKSADYFYTVAEEYVITKQLSQKCAPNKLPKRMVADGSFEVLLDYPVKEYNASAPKNTAVCPVETTPFINVATGDIGLDEFLKQFTDEELISLVSGVKNRGVACTCGIGGIDRLGIPSFMTADGPAGVRINTVVGIPTTAFPCATLLACTWNTSLAYEFGKAGALECKENGLAVWLTPAMNIHRNPLCGRNFEYFSEDPLVAGKFAAAKVKGIQSQNIAASAKHFACNNKEKNRYYSDSRLSERALREIYLRGFEICVREAQPWTVMTGYNIINSRRCCENYELLQGILRDEWGFEGMVTSDWSVPCDQTKCIKAGNDIRMPDGFPKQLQEGLEKKTLSREQLELCAKRILALLLKFE